MELHSQILSALPELEYPDWTISLLSRAAQRRRHNIGFVFQHETTSWALAVKLGDLGPDKKVWGTAKPFF